MSITQQQQQQDFAPFLAAAAGAGLLGTGTQTIEKIVLRRVVLRGI